MGANASLYIANGDPPFFNPTFNDVCTVRRCLLEHVPAELANTILECACYWPKVSTRCTSNGRYLTLPANASNDYNAAACVLLSPRLSEWTGAPYEDMFVQIQRVCFRITSHDQGWCQVTDHPGKYEASSTWFEAAIVRDSIYDKDLDAKEEEVQAQIRKALETRTHEEYPRVTIVQNSVIDDNGESDSDVWHIQTNVRGCRHSVTHSIIWTKDADACSDVDENKVFDETGRKLGRGFVRALESRDRIAIIARAMYPGWANHIGTVDVEVHYSV